MLDRLPESMTDQTRTGTYGSWYNYYVCGFSGRITLPAGLGDLPGVKQLMDELNHLDFRSSAPRCNGAEPTPVSTAGATATPGSCASARSPWW